MKTTKLTRFVSSRWTITFILIPLAVMGLMTSPLFGGDGDPELKVLKTGLGLGTIRSLDTRINCGPTCQANYTTPDMVTLEATVTPDTNSTFLGWSGDCSGMTTCSVTMNAAHSVIANFGLATPFNRLTTVTPDTISAYLRNRANAQVNTPARFLSVLPDDYRQNWILMSRSESLQTGTAQSPRILLPSANAQNVFTIGMTEHSSYPGSHHLAIEYMQWDAGDKNFRFHEVILDNIAAMDRLPDGTFRFAARDRRISIDDEKCSKCHSTRNVINLDRPPIGRPPPIASPSPGPYPATDGDPPGSVLTKNKPNWDAYDSWGGMLPFNRDRIYQGSLEAAAFKSLFNLWNWANNDDVRQILEQLALQPPHVAGSVHNITRNLTSTADDQHIRFGFDSLTPLPTTDSSIGYSFDPTAVAPTPVPQGGRYVTLRHSAPNPNPAPNTFNDDYNRPVADEGRGVQLFDLLGGQDGQPNAIRIADELINHEFATGNFGPIDVRPLVLTIMKGNCLDIDTTTNTVIASTASTVPLTPTLTTFFNTRNGLNISQVLADTHTRYVAATGTSSEIAATRSTNMPRRKVDIQRFNFDRTGDPYLFSSEPGLIQRYGGATSGDTSVNRLRQEMFRRPTTEGLGNSDFTAMGRIFVDREQYDVNARRIAFSRYFLEPLGVSVDKWSMGVRGRSRTYTFADVFFEQKLVIERELRSSLSTRPRRVTGLTDFTSCSQLITAVNSTLSSLPDPNAVPNFTDIQRIFNKSCIECHGGLGYPPYPRTRTLDLSEDERPAATNPRMMSPRLFRSYENALSYVGPNAMNRGYLWTLINRTNEDCRPPMAVGLMPCGGPALSKVDIETIRRWIDPPGEPANTTGDPHIKTVNGVNYDFQSAGEFVLLRDEYMEVQARQTAITTEGPLPPNEHTGLSSCVSLNSAAAVRMGQHRITYQPNLSGEPDPSGLQLRIDGRLTPLTGQEILLPSGSRIIRTPAPGGIQIEGAGGTTVTITPDFWDHYRVWFLNIDVSHARATQGVMGAIAPGNWLPAMPDGSQLGPRPRDLNQRYLDLYDKFENAWRVTDATTLFDYKQETSTATFTLDSWPAAFPQTCVAPPPPVGPVSKAPLKALPLETAQQHCSGIVAADMRDNCVKDVMITGEPKFARSYLATEQVLRNARPTAPDLGFPEDNQIDLDKPITFTWNNATDSDGDPVNYRHCVWVTGDKVGFNNCTVASVHTTQKGRGWWLALLIALLVALVLLILAFVFLKQRRIVLAFIAVVIVGAIVLAFYIGRTNTRGSLASRTVTTLESGQTYLWKVIAEDGKGGTTESQTRRFTTR